MFLCSRRTRRRTDGERDESRQPLKPASYAGVSISGLIVHRPCFFGAGIFYFLFLPNLVEHPTRNEMETLRKVIRFYVEGFREMTVGRTLWAIILIKLFILFAVLKVFFFPDLLAGKSPSEKAGCVLENLTPEIPQP